MAAFLLLFASVGLLVALAQAAPKSAGTVGRAAAALLVVFAGLRGIDMDHEQYLLLMDVFAAADLPAPARWLVAKDPLFGLLLDAVLSVGGGPQLMFFLTALTSVAVKQRAFAKAFDGQTAIAWMATLCLYFFLHDYTQLRSALAVAFCFLSLQAMVNQQRRAWLGWALVATGFHISALMFLPLSAAWWWGRQRRVLGTLVTAACLSLLISGALTMLGDFDPRAQEHAELTGTTWTPIVVGLMKWVALTLLLHRLERQQTSTPLTPLLQACYGMAATGLVWMLVLRGSSSALAFRFYEFFDAFSVFPIAAALMQLRGVPWLIAVLYCLLGIALQAATGLFVPYELADFSEFFGSP